MNTYIIDVRHMDRYELDADTADEAIEIVKNCVVDNYGAFYLEGATFDAIRINGGGVIYGAIRIGIPTVGDATDAGIAGE